MIETIEQEIYQVVLNDEEQYSVWRSNRELPIGWRLSGFTGSKDECLTHISQVWIDMRPLSIRPRTNG